MRPSRRYFEVDAGTQSGDAARVENHPHSPMASLAVMNKKEKEKQNAVAFGHQSLCSRVLCHTRPSRLDLCWLTYRRPRTYTFILTSLQPCRRIRCFGVNCHKRRQIRVLLSPSVRPPSLVVRRAGALERVEGTWTMRINPKVVACVKGVGGHRPMADRLSSPRNIEEDAGQTGDSPRPRAPCLLAVLRPCLLSNRSLVSTAEGWGAGTPVFLFCFFIFLGS
jgi:hypothetical protein